MNMTITLGILNIELAKVVQFHGRGATEIRGVGGNQNRFCTTGPPPTPQLVTLLLVKSFLSILVL